MELETISGAQRLACVEELFLALFERRRQEEEEEEEEKFKKDSAVLRVLCMYLYSSQGCKSLHSCYRHLTGLHFPGMRYVVVLWPDPKTPATDSAPVDQRLKSMARDEVSICLPRHK